MTISLNGPQEYGQTVEITRSVKGGDDVTCIAEVQGECRWCQRLGGEAQGPAVLRGGAHGSSDAGPVSVKKDINKTAQGGYPLIQGSRP